MGYFKAGKGAEFMENTSKEKVEDIAKYPFKACKERGISKETCERFGIRAGLSEEDGKSIEAFYFPSYNKKGKLVGYMKQNVTLPKEEKGHWTTVGAVSIGNKLFGQDIAESINRKHTSLVITEGQWDCVSVYQALVDSVKGTKYEGMEPFVVSIPLGTANAVEAILHNEEWTRSFDSLCIYFDDDYCTPAERKKNILKGHEAREAIANAFVGSGISLMTITPAEGFKDASDYMQAGKSEELAKLVQFGKRPYSAEKIVKAKEISLDELLEPRPEGIYVESFPKLMDKIHGFRTSELVLLTSPSNTGKSTVLSLFANAFVDAGEKIGMIYLEETNKETMQRLVASKLKVNYLKFKDKPLELATMGEIQDAYDDIVNNDKLVMLSHFGSLPVSELMNKIKHMHLVEGCRYILLDHLSMVISGLETDNERKQLDIVMTELAAFCAANDVCVIAVSHINRTNANQFVAPKGKENEPYWVQVTKESMRGSSSLEQLSFIILGLEPQIMPDRSRGNVRLTVLKNRPWGYLGVCDEFKIDDNTWEVVLAEDEALDGF
jgi:KaiC/GvpD/RAD55 family RecA-like ATPase